MDGYSATKKLRKAKLDTLPVVVRSVLTSPDEVEKMFEVGMNGYLAKPFYYIIKKDFILFLLYL